MLNHDHLILLVLFGHLNLDPHLLGSRDIFADIIGTEGEFAMAPVDQYRQLDLSGTPEIDQLIDGGADGPPGKQHVVAQHQFFAVDGKWDIGVLQLPACPC